MKKLVFMTILGCIAILSNAQNGVGIGTNNPHASALLDVSSINKGVLVPRMFTTQRLGIGSPAKGLLVFDNNTNSFWFHNGTAWTQLAGGSGNNIWQQVQDSIAHTDKPYVNINFDNGLFGPQASLQVNGSLLVQGKLNYSSSNPTPAQTYTMDNTSAQQIIGFDSVFRIYDPGGTGNYNNNMQGNIRVLGSNNFKVSSAAANFGLGTGDTLWISEMPYPYCRTQYEKRFTSTDLNPDDFIVSSPDNNLDVYFIFRSNGNSNNGPGFNIKVTRLFEDEFDKEINIAGPALQFNHGTGAFSAGISNKVRNGGTAFGLGTEATGRYSFAVGDLTRATGYTSFATGWRNYARGFYCASIGVYTEANGDASIAMGAGSEANGDYSTAMGNYTQANARSSTAMGNATVASGESSTAMGDNTTAAGEASVAMGIESTAVGAAAIAMGNNVLAAGSGSIAMGSYVSTAGLQGCLVIGDNSTTSNMSSATINSFRARFDGGYRFYTSSATITSESCLLAGGSNAWSTTSDVRLKENFEPVNGEDFLQKISAMPLSSWNYKKQNPATFRHYGPMAQDFYAAFGKDRYGYIGNDTTINSADFDGVNMIAIQALEKRTQKIQQLENENAALKTQQQQVSKEMEDIKARLQKLEELLSKKNE